MASGPEAGPAGPELRRAFLRAEWRHLAMLHFEIDPAILLPHLPPRTELESFQGRHHLGLVGFRFLRTRLLGVPVPFHQAYTEVNLRFYVRGKVDGQWRSGVRFLRELVARPAVTLVARRGYGEPYETRPVEARLEGPDPLAPTLLRYRWTGPAGGCGFEVERAPEPLAPGGLGSFLAEHHWGFGVDGRQRALAYPVERPAWELYPALKAIVHGDLGAFYGEPFAEALRRAPASALVAAGSEVAVGFPQRVDA